MRTRASPLLYGWDRNIVGAARWVAGRHGASQHGGLNPHFWPKAPHHSEFWLVLFGYQHFSATDVLHSITLNTLSTVLVGITVLGLVRKIVIPGCDEIKALSDSHSDGAFW
jgi:hypothetical protein